MKVPLGETVSIMYDYRIFDADADKTFLEARSTQYMNTAKTYFGFDNQSRYSCKYGTNLVAMSNKNIT